MTAQGGEIEKWSAYLLLEVSPILLINQDQVEVVSYTELLVHLAERWCQVEATEEQANGNGFTCAAAISPDTRYVSESVPLTGAPSMISNFVIVSLSLYWFGGEPVVSRRMIDSSMCLILIRTSRK